MWTENGFAGMIQCMVCGYYHFVVFYILLLCTDLLRDVYKMGIHISPLNKKVSLLCDLLSNNKIKLIPINEEFAFSLCQLTGKGNKSDCKSLSRTEEDE